MTLQTELTNLDLVQYLLSQDDTKMRGTIRPISVQSKCPKCQRLFEEIAKVGFICREHLTIPRKFYIDIWHEGKRYRIFSDKYNNVLDGYSLAKSLLMQINNDMGNHTFNPSHYVRKDRENYSLKQDGMSL